MPANEFRDVCGACGFVVAAGSGEVVGRYADGRMRVMHKTCGPPFHSVPSEAAPSSDVRVKNLEAEVRRLHGLLEETKRDVDMLKARSEAADAARKARKDEEDAKRRKVREAEAEKVRREQEARRQHEERRRASEQSQSGWTASNSNFLYIYNRFPFDSASVYQSVFGGSPGAAPPIPECLRALGLVHGATGDQIKDAYRLKAKSAHPDGGGSQAEFVALRKHYEDAMRLVGAVR